MKKVIATIRGKRAWILSILAVLALSGTTAVGVLAAIPDANGTVHACYTNVIGTLRIIDSPTASCNIAETPISWNQKPNIKYAESTAEYSLTPAESEAANHSADLGGPDLTVSVPSGTGSLVKFYGNLEIKANCEVYPVVTVIDETNNDNFGNGGDAPVQIYTAGPVENYVLYTLGGGQASTGFQYTVPATAGTHTYSMRYKSTAYGENGTCPAYFRNMKLWAEVVSPS